MRCRRVVYSVKDSFFQYRVELLEGGNLSVFDSTSWSTDLTQLLSPPQKLEEYLTNSAPRLAPYPAPQRASRRSYRRYCRCQPLAQSPGYRHILAWCSGCRRSQRPDCRESPNVRYFIVSALPQAFSSRRSLYTHPYFYPIQTWDCYFLSDRSPRYNQGLRPTSPLSIYYFRPLDIALTFP